MVTTGILMYGKMSFGASTADPIPSRKMRSERTTKVYGRRSASLTIHIAQILPGTHYETHGSAEVAFRT
jgi:hypothetical protein